MARPTACNATIVTFKGAGKGIRAVSAMPPPMRPAATFRTERRTPRCASQSRRFGPDPRDRRSHSWASGDERMKK